MTTAAAAKLDQQALQRTLEAELRNVRTIEDAERIVAELERLAAGTTEGEQASAAKLDSRSAAQEVQHAAADAPGRRREVAAVLAETAQQTAAPTREGKAAAEAAREVMKPPTPEAAAQVEPEAARGAELLKRVVLRRLGPLQALDAQVFLAINRAPHPGWSDRMANVVAIVTTGGWIWAGVLLVARALGVRSATRALPVLVPCISVATWTVENPIKAFFRRRRPFIDVVRALVVGKRPGSWSFPSGHTASSFAAAWTLSTIWPRWSALFMGIATCIGFSRIYVGAHYPGDVTSGAFCGMALAELVRQGVTRALGGSGRMQGGGRPRRRVSRGALGS